MSKDRISIAMTTFNGERYLQEQLNSLYTQTRVPDEVFVSDDGSEDSTVDILKEFQHKYGLKYCINDHSIGVNMNFEHAIRSCSGDYIMICDQDDIWLPEKIEKTYNKMKEIEEDKPSVVSSQHWIINGNGEIISKKTNIKKDSLACADTLLMPAGTSQGCSLMINKKLLDNLKSFPKTEDCMYDSYISFICASIGLKYNMSNPLMLYRHHDNNVLARISLEKKNISRHLLSLLRELFSPATIPYKRRAIFDMIRRDYESIFTNEAKSVYEQAYSYFSSNSRIEQIVCIMKMKDLDIGNRFRLILGTIIYGISGKM